MNSTVVAKKQQEVQRMDDSSVATGRSERRRQSVNRDARWLGVVAFIVGNGLGAYLTLHLRYMSYDAVSRVAHAFFVLWSRDPHLGAIGFVWTPLSSILAMPLVLLYPLWPALVREGVAGIPISALFSGIGTYYLARLLLRFGVPRGWRIGMVFAYMLNPLILLYSANGMTDGMMVACVIATYTGVFEYLEMGSLRSLISAALWLVIGLGVRYEAVPFAIMVALGLAIAQVIRKVSWSKIQGTAIVLLAPITAGGAAWLYFNWLIMKNPFYFLDGTYSNIAQTSLSGYEQHIRAHEMFNPLHSFLYIGRFSLLFWPIIVGVLVALFFLARRRPDSFIPVLLGGIIGPLILDYYLLFKGNLAPWDRYFIYYIPSGLVLVTYLGSTIARRVSSIRRTAVWTLITLLLLGGSAGTYIALKSPRLGSPDGGIVASALQNKSMFSLSKGDLALIHYMNTHPHMLVLTDDFTTGVPIVLQVNNPKQFIITSDYNYKSILLNPRGRVSAFLVPQPTGANMLVDIDKDYPGMWYGKVPWVHVIRQFNDVNGTSYRLYGIDSNAP